MSSMPFQWLTVSEFSRKVVVESNLINLFASHKYFFANFTVTKVTSQTDLGEFSR